MGKRAEIEQIIHDVEMLGDDLSNEKARFLIESFQEIISELNLEMEGVLGTCDDLRDEVRSLEEQLEGLDM